MGTKVDFNNVTIEIHDDGSKELDAGLRPLDHYKQVSFHPVPTTDDINASSVSGTNSHYDSQSSLSYDGKPPILQNYRYYPP